MTIKLSMMGGGESIMNPFRLHAHIHSLSHTETHTSTTVSGREGYWDGKRCIFRADLKADVELE